MIEKHYFQPNLRIYYRDYLLALLVFALAFGVSVMAP